MNVASIKDVMMRLKHLERTSARLRKGVVTAVGPLAVDLGDAGVAHSNVSAIDGLALGVGDVVAALMRGNEVVVLGRLTNDPSQGTLGFGAAGSISLGVGATGTCFGGQQWDPNGIYNDGTGTITIPVTGTWRMFGFCEHQNANANTSGIILALRNGGAYGRPFARVFSPVAAGTPAGGSSRIRVLDSGDTILFRVVNLDNTTRTIAWDIGMELLAT